MDKFLEVMVPARAFLRYTDTRFSLACRVYEGFSDLQEKVAALGQGSGFTEDDRDIVASIICGRWDDAHHAVHAAGYLLGPENIGTDVTEKQETFTELQEGFDEVLGRLLSPAEVVAANLEWARYKKSDGISPGKLGLVDKMPPLDF